MSPRWVAVCEAPFLPARDGGQREHLGMVTALAARGRLAGVVIAARAGDVVDPDTYRAAIGAPTAADATTAGQGLLPVVTVARTLTPAVHLHPTTPFVWASRRPSDAERRRLAPLVAGADGVLACSFKSADLALALARPTGRAVVVRQHNVESRYHRDLGASRRAPARAYYRWEAARIARAERAMAADPGVAGLAEISAVDAGERVVGAHQRSALVPPLAVDLTAELPAGPRAGVLFLGALDVATNQHGLRWLLAEVWPRVRAAAPAAVLTVAGRRPDPGFAAWLAARPGVRTVFDVLDPRALMGAAVVAVNPTVSGSGINIKLLEYAASGAAVVTTPRAVAGLPPTDHTGLVAAEDPATFAAGVVDALADPTAAAARGAALAAALAAALDPDTAVDTLTALMHGRPEESPACLPSRS